MLQYYSIITVLCLLTLITLHILIDENSRLSPKAKRNFRMAYVAIAQAMLAEWVGLLLNGASASLRPFLILAKCFDYTLTPIAGIYFVHQVSQKEKLNGYLRILLAGNGLLQLISVFTGWTFYVDAENVYHHGPAYDIYVFVYIAICIIVFAEFIRYGKQFSKKNLGSLFGSMLLLICGIAFQEIWNLHIAYLSMTLFSALLFIHYSEFSQMTSDAHLSYQQKLLDTDVLTGLQSRYAYNNALQQYAHAVPTDLVVFSMDLNELKSANDHLGHLAGDELIQGAASCILKALSGYGKCYRTGGDEFIALLHMRPHQIPQALAQLNELTESWRGKLVHRLRPSTGIASAAEYPTLTIEKLVILADEAMYREKDAYYEKTQVARRH